MLSLFQWNWAIWLSFGRLGGFMDRLQRIFWQGSKCIVEVGDQSTACRTGLHLRGLPPLICPIVSTKSCGGLLDQLKFVSVGIALFGMATAVTTVVASWSAWRGLPTLTLQCTLWHLCPFLPTVFYPPSVCSQANLSFQRYASISKTESLSWKSWTYLFGSSSIGFSLLLQESFCACFFLFRFSSRFPCRTVTAQVVIVWLCFSRVLFLILYNRRASMLPWFRVHGLSFRMPFGKLDPNLVKYRHFFIPYPMHRSD